MLKRIVKDVVVVGGGAAGLSLMTALQNSPTLRHLRLGLVDAQPLAKLADWPERMADKEIKNRVVSLTPESVDFLDKIGAWQHVVQERTQPYDEMYAWDGCSTAGINFDGWSSDSGVIATMIENSNLQQALYRSHAETAKLAEHAKVAEISVDRTTQWPIVGLSNGVEIMTRLLVGADGQQSPVREFAGIASRGWDYNRFGVVATLHLEFDNFRSVAYQRFLRTGPLAVLPLPDGRATLVWSTLPERAQWLKQLVPTAMAAMVNAGTRLDMVDIDFLHTIDPKNTDEIVDEVAWRLQQLEDASDDALPVLVETAVEGSVAAFPLRMRHADAYIADRVALVGDAAHATHPLSGQGLNMGQRDVQALVEALELATERGLDIGSSLALEPYPRAIYAANHVLLGVNDKLHKLYSTDCWPVVRLRSMGLNVVESLPWLKQAIIQGAQ